MSNTKFYLRSLKSDRKQSTIWLYSTWNSRRLRLSTEIIAKNSDFDKSNFRLKGNSFGLENRLLSKLRTKADDIIRDHKLESKTLTEDFLKSELLQIISPDKAVRVSGEIKYNLISFCQYYIETNPENLKEETIGSYRSLLNLYLAPFIKKYGKDMAEFHNVDKAWGDLFKKFISDKGKRANYEDKLLKNVIKLMNYSLTLKKHSSRDFEQIKRHTEDSYAIYLNEDEIKALYELDIKENMNDDGVMELTRDLVVFMCLTGLRIGSALAIQKADWHENYVYITPDKNKKNVRLKIPLRVTAKAILEKYDGSFPKIAEGTVNEKIKLIAANIPSLQNKVTYTYTIGGERRTEVKPKYELVMAHSGRRSFATNEYKRGTPVIDIMAITGHKKVQTFMIYIKEEQSEKAERMLASFQQRAF